MTGWQRTAIENWTLIPEEQARPMFAHYTREEEYVPRVPYEDDEEVHPF